MSKLFSPFVINGMALTNRFVRSATWEGMAGEDGAVTDKLVACLADLAKGGVGMVVSGHAYVEKRGQAGPWKTGVHDAAMLPGLARLAKAVQEAGGKLVMQLAHAGCRANAALTGEPALGPSAVDDPKAPCRAMTEADIRQTVAAFGQAAALCRQAGADGVQLHAAHGYLISQFLSPRYNRRADAYGGPLENRARLLREVLAEVREKVGRDYPVLAKLNSEDFLDGGMTLAESLDVAAWLEQGGLDALEVSGGTGDSGKLMPVRPGKVAIPAGEAYYREAAKQYKARLGIPVILVGGIRSIETAEDLVDSGTCDLVALSRPLIREPGLVARWQSGDRRPSECLSDNLCFRPAITGKGIYCLAEELARKKGKA